MTTDSASTPRLSATATPVGDAMLTYADLAARLSIGLRTCKRWVATGTLPAPDLRIGGVVRWKPDTLERWLVRQGRVAR